MAAVVVCRPLGLAGPHRKCWCRALCRLDLGFLVHAQYHRTIWRGEVKANDVAHLLDEGWVRGELEGLRPVRPQSKSTPDARHRGLAHAGAARHGACAPVRGVAGRLLERQGDQALDCLVADGPRRSGAWRIHQPVQPMLGKAPTPRRHRLSADAQRLGHAQISGTRLGARQDHPNTLRQSLPNAAPAQQTPQLDPLGLGQLQRHGHGSPGHDAPPFIRHTIVTPPAKSASGSLTRTTRLYFQSWMLMRAKALHGRRIMLRRSCFWVSIGYYLS